MKVILLQDIKSIGKKDDVINANDGYVRNYLFPKKFAVEATKENMLKLEAKKKSMEHKKSLEIAEARKLAREIEKINLDLTVKAGENGKTFGGVASKEIAEELEKQYKIKVDKKRINLKETIKTIGVFTVEVKLGDGVVGKLKINIKAE